MTRIRTTHTGSLPRPPEILEAVRQHFATGKPMDEITKFSCGSWLVREKEAGTC
jgi:methionine synthase II (cobalamin-independent)